MINYVEKGIGLHQAIIAAGQWLRQENGEWVSSDDEAVQSIIDSYDGLSGAIAQRKNDVDVYSKRLRDKIVAPYSAGEMAKWSAKYHQAKLYDESKLASDAPDLSAEALDAQCTIDDVVSRVISNGDAFSALEASISGNARRHKSIIEAMNDFNAILAYDFSDGWPV